MITRRRPGQELKPRRTEDARGPFMTRSKAKSGDARRTWSRQRARSSGRSFAETRPIQPARKILSCSVPGQKRCRILPLESPVYRPFRNVTHCGYTLPFSQPGQASPECSVGCCRWLIRLLPNNWMPSRCGRPIVPQNLALHFRQTGALAGFSCGFLEARGSKRPSTSEDLAGPGPAPAP